MDILLPSILNVVTAAACITFGLVVLTRNYRKVTHQAFALIAFNLALWAMGVFAVIQSGTPASSRIWLTLTEMTAAFIPATFYTFIGFFPKGRFDGNKTYLRCLYGAAVVLSLATLTPWYVTSIQLLPNGPPRVVYGPAFVGIPIIFLTTVVVIHNNLRRKLRELRGIERRQIQFTMLAIYATLALGALTNLLAPVFDVRLFQAYGPVSSVVLMGFFAYAMVRYHLLDTRVLLSRLMVYLVAVAFVLVTFVGFVTLAQWFVGGRMDSVEVWPTVFAALLITLVFEALKGRVRKFIDGTLLRNRYDINRLYSRITQQAAEGLHLEALLENVATDIQNTVGVKVIRVHLFDEEDPSMLTTEYTTVPDEKPMRTRQHAPLLAHLKENPYPIVLEKILHRRPDRQTAEVARHLADLDAYVCLPLKTKSGLVGIMTLGQKDSHDVYSSEEEVAFHALAGALATAIANARLYRELEHLHLHLSRVFRQMREGVVAVDPNGKITTTNAAAINMLGPVAVGQPLDALQQEVADLLRRTLKNERGLDDFETVIPGPAGDPIPVVMSSSFLRSPGKETWGAVALIYNLSQVKRLEEKVRRADRLSSIGTLAAGMAHEIKNPLVSIKTFTQLFQTRYNDPEFRKTFDEIVPHEVDRIDTIVTQLLDIARPRPVIFETQDLLPIVEAVLALVDKQMRDENIRVTLDFPEESVIVRGDEQQLHQLFLNLVLNALDSMKEDDRGALHVSARLGHMHVREKGRPGVVEKECVRVQMSDTGHGIPEASIRDLFTPFFTTKSDGSGLGLAVVHTIVQEHGGEIDVKSTTGKGTTFSLALPLEPSPLPIEAK